MHPFDAERWEEVKSSNLKAIGIRDEFLIVEFKNNVFYRYPDMADHLDDLLTAESVGKYFNNEIRNQACERLRADIWPDE